MAALENSWAACAVDSGSSPTNNENSPASQMAEDKIDRPPDGENSVKQGDLLRILFPSEFAGIHEEDVIRAWDKATLSQALSVLESLTSDERPPDLSAINVAQYCQTLFWNIVRFFGPAFEQGVKTLNPSLEVRTKRRKRPLLIINEAAIFEKEKQERLTERRIRIQKRRVQYSELLQKSFLELQRKLAVEAATKLKKIDQIRLENASSKHRRLPSLPDCDETQVVASVIDAETGVFKRPMYTLNETQKRVVYHKCLENQISSPVLLDFIESKGRAVMAGGPIAKDDFVLEYRGELLTDKKARSMEVKYNRDSAIHKGSFVFYFKYDGKNFAIDSTSETRSFGVARLINHSRKNPNLVPKTLLCKGAPRLFFVAKRNIEQNEELLVDYGERDPVIVQNNPWLEES